MVARLGPEALRGHHRRLALALEASGGADPEVLGAHFRAAGEDEKAGRYFAAGGRPGRRLPRLRPGGEAIPTGTGGASGRRECGRGGCAVALGDALANAGRGAEAARAYLEAAEGATVAEALELRRRTALQYLISGHIDEGLAALRSVLGAVGMRLPATPSRCAPVTPVAVRHA